MTFFPCVLTSLTFICIAQIKGRVLGFGNPDYADTMYHLGVVLCFLYALFLSLCEMLDGKTILSDLWRSIHLFMICGL